MEPSDFTRLRIAELVSLYRDTGVAWYELELQGEYSKVNHLALRTRDIEEELKRRPGDERQTLFSLYTDPNVQVRLNAAKATLALAPEKARRQLQAIKDFGWQPQAADAGMCLLNLDRGVFKPT